MKQFQSVNNSSLETALIRSQTVNDESKHYLNIKNTLNKVAQQEEKIEKIVNRKIQAQKSLSKYNKSIGTVDPNQIKNLKKEIEGYDEEIFKLEKQTAKIKELDSFLQKNIRSNTLISYLQSDQNTAAEQHALHMRTIGEVLLKTLETFLKLDSVVTKTRQTFGMLPKEGRYLFGTIKDTTIQMAHLGVTFEDVGNALKGLADTFTGIVAQDETLLKTTTMLNKSFGISNEISANFSKTLAGISDTTASSQQSMVGFAKNISVASGVPLDQLMSDVANASDNVRMFVGESAVKMVKVAAEARMLGTSLSNAADTAKHFLNFESSINAELKASALLGRQINFNEARRMSFNKDTIGATKEILRLTKEVGFNQLNPIQQEAYAAAAGKSATELQSMLQQEKNIQYIRSHGSDKDRERLDSYEKMLKLSKDRAKDEGEIARLEMLKLSNQTKMAQIQDQFNQLILELQDPLLNIAGFFMEIAVVGMPLLISGIKIFTVAMSGPVQLVKLLSEKFKSIKSFFGLFKSFKPLLSLFGRLNPLFFPIITALSFIGHWFKDAEKFGGGFIGGLKAIPLAIVKAFLPFKFIHDYLDKWFIGKSPSKLGLGIVKGIVSIGPMLLDALIQPFIMGYNWIQNSFIGGLIPGGTIKIPSLGIGGEDVSDSGSDSNKTSTSLNDIKVSNEVIASKIDELITLMANGGISVNLDGTRVNESLDTSRFNRGNRGIASSIS